MDDLISRHSAIDALVKRTHLTWEDLKIIYPMLDVLEKLSSAQSERPSEVQKILNYLDTVLHPIVSPEHWNVYSELYDMISMLPSTQTEVIRCKDCKYARLTPNGSCKYCDIWFPDEAEYMDGDYYCASAERKSNG